VVGVDTSAAQLAEAARRGGGVAYTRASAGTLPLAGESFDAVVTCLVLEHLPDLDGPLDEVARVLRPGGRFVVFINHPLFQTPSSGWIDDHPRPARAVLADRPVPAGVRAIEEVDRGCGCRSSTARWVGT
jgi:SAM-dependent methyltransferase